MAGIDIEADISNNIDISIISRDGGLIIAFIIKFEVDIAALALNS